MAVLLSLRKVFVIKDHGGPTYKCPSSDLSPWNFRGLCILQAQCDNYEYDAPESRWRRQGTGYESRSQIEEGMNCLRKSFVQLPAPVKRVFSTSGLSMHPHSAHVGNKLLSELVMIKSNIKPQPVYYCVECKTHVSLTVTTDDSDSLLIWQWWCSTSTISVWWKLMSSEIGSVVVFGD